MYTEAAHWGVFISLLKLFCKHRCVSKNNCLLQDFSNSFKSLCTFGKSLVCDTNHHTPYFSEDICFSGFWVFVGCYLFLPFPAPRVSVSHSFCLIIKKIGNKNKDFFPLLKAIWKHAIFQSFLFFWLFWGPLCFPLLFHLCSLSFLSFLHFLSKRDFSNSVTFDCFNICSSGM